MTALPIFFSSDTIPTVSVDDVVKAGQIIAREAHPKNHVINLCDEFSVSEDKARKCLRKKPGDMVNAGDVLAAKKNFLGLSEDKLVSKVSGKFSRYERDTGNLIISIESGMTYTDIVSPVDGIITICDNDKIVIGTEKDVYFGRKGAGGKVIGEVFVLDGAFSDNGNEELESDISVYYDLDSRAVGKIVIGTSFPRDLLIKCIGMEAKGIVGTEISDDVLDYLNSRNMRVPIIEADIKTVNSILQWKNKKIYLNSQEKEIVLLHA